MSKGRVVTLELRGATKAFIVAKLIEARIEVLSQLSTREAVIEFLNLQEIAMDMRPQIKAIVEEERKEESI